MATVTLPKTLTAKTEAKAADVMANFNAIVAQMNGKVDAENLAEVIRNALIPTATILATAASAAPTGFLMCEGQAVSRSTYSALFAAIGTTYGAGDGTTTFNLPDLRGRTPVGADGAAGRLIANDALGNVGGDSRMAAHLHTFTTNGTAVPHQHMVGGHASAGFQAGSSFVLDVLTRGGTSEQTGFENIIHSHGGATDATGASPLSPAGDSNMPPYQVVAWMVKV